MIGSYFAGKTLKGVLTNKYLWLGLIALLVFLGIAGGMYLIHRKAVKVETQLFSVQMEAATAKAQVEKYKESIKKVDELQKKMKEVTNDSKDFRRMLDKSENRLERLVEARPELMSNRMRTATNKLWKEFEAISGGESLLDSSDSR